MPVGRRGGGGRAPRRPRARRRRSGRAARGRPRRAPRLRAPSGPKRQHVAVLGQQHAVGGQPRLARPAARAARACGTRRARAPGSAAARSAAARPGRRGCRGRRRGRAAVPGCTTSQPRRKRLLISARDRALVAGDRRARRARPCRRAPRATSRCSPTLTMRQRGERLALAARDEHERAEARGVARATRLDARQRAAGMRSRPRSSATSALSSHAAAEEGDAGARAAAARSATRWMRGIEVAKQETSTRPRVRARIVLEGGRHVVLAAGAAALLDVGAVGEQREHAALAPGRRAPRGRCARRPARLRVDLEVAARQHHARRRLDGEGQAVDHAVRDADRVDAEGADLDRLRRA